MAAVTGSRVKVALVDSGGTNIASVRYALDRIGAEARLTADPAQIGAADRVILPGVGAAGAGMRRLREASLVEVLHDLEQPLLGVCLGMQLLFERSAEDGGVDCLGLLAGEVVPIPRAPGLRVPHMGWNTLTGLVQDPILAGIEEGERAYFVHSYAAPPGRHTLAVTTHGDPLSAVVRCGLRWGAQFHPERSASVGFRLLRNFVQEVAR